MARRPKITKPACPVSSGPITRIVATSVQIGRLDIAEDGKTVRGVEPILEAAPEAAAMMDRIRKRAVGVVPFEDRVDAVILEQQQIIDAQAGSDGALDVDARLAAEALTLLATARRFLPDWSPETRTAIALAMRAQSLLERQFLRPFERATKSGLKLLPGLDEKREKANVSSKSRASANAAVICAEALRHWAVNPKLLVSAVARRIERDQVKLGIRPRPVKKGPPKPVQRRTIEDAIRNLDR